MKYKTYALVTILFLIILTIEFCHPKDKSETKYTTQNNSYAGDEACKSCHANQYKDWLQSDHYKSIQKATDSSVLGDFNNATYKADGVESHYFKKDNKFYINTQGDDGMNHDYEIVYAFGHYPLQQYLVQFPDGKIQATRDSWDSKSKKWFHQYAGQNIHYRDWLHWTGNAQNWNTMCAECHSTDYKKNYSIENDSYHSTFSILKVSCEACHGMGKNHIDYINSNDYKAGNKIKNSLLLLANNTDQNAQINTCAPCHAVQSNIDSNKLVSEELLDNYIPQIPNTERFQADGQVREEDYNYASFLQSKMYARNVKCSNCHNPHSGKLVMTGNQVCMQCHAKTYDSPEHHKHNINTAGSTCINCHAPGKYYMGNDLRHDHSFRAPRPDLSVQYKATTNACNDCHKDKSAQWASDAVVKWYGPKRKYHFAEDLIPGSTINDKSESHLIKLIADTSVPDIIKATAANYLGKINTPNSLNTLMSCLSHKNALVRYHALESLINFSASISDKKAVAVLLKDKVKAVRIAAAQLVNSIGINQFLSEYQSDYNKAKTEAESHLLFNADFAHGNIAIGDYYARNNDYEAAQKYYVRAIKKDSLANLARLNLAITYNSKGDNAAALTTLLEAIKTDPKNAQAWYNIALIYSELKDNANALKSFEKAVILKADNPRLYYNYSLLLQQTGNKTQAISTVQKGLTIYPEEESLNYIMAYLLIEDKQLNKAISYAKRLQQMNPDNPDYQQIFSVLQLK